MKAIPLKQNIANYAYLKTEAKDAAEYEEKEALKNEVILFETEREKELFVQGFMSGACWQKGRGDAKCLDLLEWIKERFVACCDEEATPCEWWWEIDADTSGKKYTTKEVFYEYDKNILTF